jgi:hypothetical protein
VPDGITLATSKTKSVNRTSMTTTVQMDCSNRSRQAQPDLLVRPVLNVRLQHAQTLQNMPQRESFT